MMKLSKEDKKLFRQIQGDLPISLTPFESLAGRIGWDEKRLLQRIQFFIHMGMIRRFGAILRHKKAGYQGNAMVVWKVPEDQITQFSQVVTSCPAVSHCYLRSPLPEWAFNLYTMVHGRSEKDCLLSVKEISRKTGQRDYQLLFSRREHKKSSMRYFETF